jgi:hypothetical protein
MNRVVDRIVFAILAIVYLTVNSGTLIGQMRHSAHRTVPLTVDGSSSPDGAHGKHVWTPRRHLPMVRDISTLAGFLPLAGEISEIAEYSLISTLDQPLHIPSLYYSVLSDRAPPIF